jgi:hypothetical protein
MKNFRYLLAVLISILGSARADVVNGDFETGDLTGWYSKGIFFDGGTTAMARGVGGYFPMSGAASALIVAVSGAPVPPYNCIQDIWNVNCPLPLGFSTSSAPPPSYSSGFMENSVFRYGAYLGQDVNVVAGDVLTWNWIPGGEAQCGCGGIDGARFFAMNADTQLFINDSQNIRTFTFPASGKWSIYFGLYQGMDYYLYSTLELDSVKISSVPEVANTWLLLFGLSTVFFVRRSRAQKV